MFVCMCMYNTYYSYCCVIDGVFLHVSSIYGDDTLLISIVFLVLLISL